MSRKFSPKIETTPSSAFEVECPQMVFLHEIHREVVLDLLNNASFNGANLDVIFGFKQAVLTSKIYGD